jgi:hypothetical protein
MAAANEADDWDEYARLQTALESLRAAPEKNAALTSETALTSNTAVTSETVINSETFTNFKTAVNADTAVASETVVNAETVFTSEKRAVTSKTGSVSKTAAADSSATPDVAREPASEAGGVSEIGVADGTTATVTMTPTTKEAKESPWAPSGGTALFRDASLLAMDARTKATTAMFGKEAAEGSTKKKTDTCELPTPQPDHHFSSKVLEDDGVVESDSDDDADADGSVISTWVPDKIATAVKQAHRIHGEILALVTSTDVPPAFLREDQKLKELQGQFKLPPTVIGVLGNTGVGKSSLLNSILGEASILPTSGSRGCTACVCVMVFNDALTTSSGSLDFSPPETPVYRAEVEFMGMEEWVAELGTLVDACADSHGKIFPAPVPDTEEVEHAAWQKIEQVYGRGALTPFLGASKDSALKAFKQDRRLQDLLIPDVGSSDLFNVRHVSVGAVEAGGVSAVTLAKGHRSSDRRLFKQKEEWARSFRAKVNDYVYRKGNGDAPQDWPLIRKVTMHGPWPVLESGASLVDLPGVRDSNAARAGVAETFLKNCTGVWIVAPIKRAVDDSTAKELMVDCLKKRKALNGQLDPTHQKLAFVCTQTDDIECSEVWTDHQDVAGQVEGRFKTMDLFFKEMETLQLDSSRLKRDLGDSKAAARTGKKGKNRLKLALSALREQLKSAESAAVAAAASAAPAGSDPVQKTHDENTDARCGGGATKAVGLDSEANTTIAAVAELEALRAGVTKAAAGLAAAAADVARNKAAVEDFEKQLVLKDEAIVRLQATLKPLCAAVRNEYAESQLQQQFKLTVEEMVHGASGDGDGNSDDEDDTQQQSKGPPYSCDKMWIVEFSARKPLGFGVDNPENCCIVRSLADGNTTTVIRPGDFITHVNGEHAQGGVDDVKALLAAAKTGVDPIIRVTFHKPLGEDFPPNVVLQRSIFCTDNGAAAAVLPVFCISANDFLKIQGIKSAGDGQPNTFRDAADTQIPALSEFVHRLTSGHRELLAKSVLPSLSQVLRRIHTRVESNAAIASSKTAPSSLGAEEAPHLQQGQVGTTAVATQIAAWRASLDEIMESAGITPLPDDADGGGMSEEEGDGATTNGGNAANLVDNCDDDVVEIVDAPVRDTKDVEVIDLASDDEDSGVDDKEPSARPPATQHNVKPNGDGPLSTAVPWKNNRRNAGQCPWKVLYHNILTD